LVGGTDVVVAVGGTVGDGVLVGGRAVLVLDGVAVAVAVISGVDVREGVGEGPAIVSEVGVAVEPLPVRVAVAVAVAVGVGVAVGGKGITPTGVLIDIAAVARS
jgi:hypothetical protein